MNREVYSYLLKTYSRKAGCWYGIGAQTLLMRVVSVIVIARLAADIATGNFESAKTHVCIYLMVAVTGLILRLSKDLVANKAENKVYARGMETFYKRLVSKGVSFFRDHQTGYLTSLFRQHVDSGMELARLFRSAASMYASLKSQ